LDVGQRSVIGGELLRITLELEGGPGAPPNLVETGKKSAEARIKAVATAMNVGRTSLNNAIALIKQDPEEAQAVKDGKKSLHAAKVAADAKGAAHGDAVMRIEEIH
jgi:hypothetical protein